MRLASRRPAQAPARPMVSFSFDDVPASAAEAGAAVLEARGLKGTFYVAAALAGSADAVTGPMADADAVRKLSRTGHEIGCHTYSHLDCGQAAAGDAIEDVARNAETLSAWGVSRPTTFAYPFGDVAPQTKRALAGRFSLMRALHEGVVAAGSDLNQAPSVCIAGPDAASKGDYWLHRAVERSGWLILCLHDIAEQPSAFGCTPAVLARLVDRCLEAGLEAVTVAEGASRIS
ncbi:MAG TPA: polysaccharide deacetylase family protein [Caulobacteraceae bacterium]|nr:polysaccharide deacetylase family protein [Caulobacteraceae bacterium]